LKSKFSAYDKFIKVVDMCIENAIWLWQLSCGKSEGEFSFWGHMVGGEMKNLGYANIEVFPELVKATKLPHTM
jgi:hypothetical protein